MIEITISRVPGSPTRKHDMWAARLDGEVIVAGDRDPEHAACRALLARGLTGRVAFRHEGADHASMFMDIATAAQWVVREDDWGIHHRRYEPFSSRRGSPKKRDEGSEGCRSTREDESRSSTGK